MLHPNERIRAPALDDVPGQWRRAAAGAAGSAFGARTRRGTPRPEFVLTCVPRKRQGGRVQRTPVRLARLLLCDGKRTRIAPSGTTHRSPVEVRPRATRRPVSAQYDPGLFQKQRMILSCAIHRTASALPLHASTGPTQRKHWSSGQPAALRSLALPGMPLALPGAKSCSPRHPCIPTRFHARVTPSPAILAGLCCVHFVEGTRTTTGRRHDPGATTRPRRNTLHTRVRVPDSGPAETPYETPGCTHRPCVWLDRIPHKCSSCALS